MLLSPELSGAISEALKETIGSAKPIGGGSINRCAGIETSSGKYFVKWNNADLFPGMFATESKGLALLRASNAFTVPHVIAQGTAGDDSFLILEFLESSGSSIWSEAGKSLAKLHRDTDVQFGLDHDNYIGSLKQSNRQHSSWDSFFAGERILPQVKLAVDRKLLNTKDVKHAENFSSRIPGIFPAESPSLLHGDLWSGNFMFTIKGAGIYDPAIYFGHREMDIAMTKLFGGFDEEFYHAYDSGFPLEKNWQQRTDFCNLYPLLVHVNLFGGGYVNDVRRILSAFS